ncbi:hypothetical protein K435DRAFT_817262 [Dendrothele bispora CBS 962.96]|uniref:FAD/NAD(P)-binding domain-containing protein n=1 Tax=Dendrothele bispora (strain CBS 962.96) TaxID=1314807 RepID=A0A4S8MLB0_DENBC|nr:hypothetical protein K435DRAFT_817262 [Dendrothele bispora CBS 962.96]
MHSKSARCTPKKRKKSGNTDEFGCIGSQPPIYLAQVDLDSVLFEGFMGNGFAAVKNFHGFPTGIPSFELMDKFHEQSLRFGTGIITETISKIDLFTPFEDEEAETADTVIVATGEEAYWQSVISAHAVCDGSVPILRNKPLAVIGGGDAAIGEATCTSNVTKYGSRTYVHVLVRRNELRASRSMAKRLMNHPKILLKNLRIEDVQAGEEKDLTVNGLFYAPGIPHRRSFRTQLQTNPDGYIVTRYRQAITSVGSGCMAALEAERLIAEKEMGE